MAVFKNRSRAQNSSGHDSDGAGRAQGAVELKDPRKTLQHLFLQSLIARRSMKSTVAKSIYNKCLDLCGCESWSGLGGEPAKDATRERDASKEGRS